MAPRHLDAAGRGLAELPASAFAAAVSGPVAELPGLTALESAPVLRNAEAGAPLLTRR